MELKFFDQPKNPARETRGFRLNSQYFSEMYVSNNPVGNCQTFSIAFVYKMLEFSDTEVKVIVESLYKDIGKKQILVDIRTELLDKLVLKFTPFSHNIIKTNYMSTNGSNMTLCLIQLNPTTFCND